VNDLGQVIGYSSIGNSESRAFFWDEENGMIELPTLGGNSLARAINNESEIVGYSYDESGNFFPVKWKVSTR
jgi:probable HAF family extracellular repeat protein